MPHLSAFYLCHPVHCILTYLHLNIMCMCVSLAVLMAVLCLTPLSELSASLMSCLFPPESCAPNMHMLSTFSPVHLCSGPSIPLLGIMFPLNVPWILCSHVYHPLSVLIIISQDFILVFFSLLSLLLFFRSKGKEMGTDWRLFSVDSRSTS